MLFAEALGALVAEPPWLANAGCEYDLLGLCRAVYVALVLRWPPDKLGKAPLVAPLSAAPRDALLRLPGVSPNDVLKLETDLRNLAARTPAPRMDD